MIGFGSKNNMFYFLIKFDKGSFSLTQKWGKFQDKTREE